jgi:hypothetical protein
MEEEEIFNNQKHPYNLVDFGMVVSGFPWQ